MFFSFISTRTNNQLGKRLKQSAELFVSNKQQMMSEVNVIYELILNFTNIVK